MEENLQVRTAPGTTGNRNGMPPGGGYVYRGWYVDIMPWADSGDTSTDYDTGLRRPEAVARNQAATNRCAKCHRDYRNRKHLAECR